MTIGRRTFLSTTAAGLTVAACPLMAWGSPPDLSDRRLRAAGRAGLNARLLGRDAQVYRTRLAAELAVIARLGLSRHFLVAHDLVATARQRGIAVFGGLCGASASLLCWVLGLSEVDPVEHNLPFETFINWRRPAVGPGGRPYLNIPACARRQHELLDILREQHGADQVAFASIRGDPAQRALCAAEGGLWSTTATLTASELLDARPDRDRTLTLSRLLETDDELRSQIAADSEHGPVLRLALELERNAAVTCGPECVPGGTLVVSTEDAVAGVRLDRQGAERLALWEVDCPPLPALTALATARVPPGEPDSRVWDMIGAGDTEHVVGLESHLHGYLRRLRPTSLSDLAAAQSIYRPGPIEVGLADMLVELKRGRASPWPLHPLAARAAASTYGVLLFREQLVNAVHAVAGFDLAEADLMRRAIGTKRRAELAYWEVRLTEGALHRGVARNAARQTFEILALCTPYLTSGAYSLALATLSLRMATLKAHAPEEFARVVRDAYDARS